MDFAVATFDQIRELSAAVRGKVDKIYLHWTASTYHQLFTDFHISVAGPGLDFQDGQIIIPEKNFDVMRHHTYGRNRRALGIALMCGLGAMNEQDLGVAPPTKEQIKVLSKVVAVITGILGMPVNRMTVLTHAEAAANLDSPLNPAHVNYGPAMWGGSNERWDLFVLRPGDKAGSGGDVIRNRAVLERKLIKEWTFGDACEQEAEYAMGMEQGRTISELHNAMEGNTIWSQIITEQLAETARRMAAIQNAEQKPHGFENIKIHEIREYLSQAKDIMARSGTWPGQGADIEIVGRMLLQGYPPLNIITALITASPLACGVINPMQYAEWIIQQALTPEVRERGLSRGLTFLSR